MKTAIPVGIKEKKLSIALEKYKKREISIGRAAEMADMPLTRFLDVLKERNVPFNYTVKELAEDFENFQSI